MCSGAAVEKSGLSRCGAGRSSRRGQSAEYGMVGIGCSMVAGERRWRLRFWCFGVGGVWSVERGAWSAESEGSSVEFLEC